MLLPLTAFGLSRTHPLIECNAQSKRHHCKHKGPKGVIISGREDGPGSLQSFSPHSSFSPWGLLGVRGGQSVSSTSACSDSHSWTTQEQFLPVHLSNCAAQHQISWLTTAHKHQRVWHARSKSHSTATL